MCFNEQVPTERGHTVRGGVSPSEAPSYQSQCFIVVHLIIYNAYLWFGNFVECFLNMVSFCWMVVGQISGLISDSFIYAPPSSVCVIKCGHSKSLFLVTTHAASELGPVSLITLTNGL